MPPPRHDQRDGFRPADAHSPAGVRRDPWQEDSMEFTSGELSRRSLLKTGAVTLGAAGFATVLASPAAAGVRDQSLQHDWRWCNYCQCLFYEKNYTSGCCPRAC